MLWPHGCFSKSTQLGERFPFPLTTKTLSSSVCLRPPGNNETISSGNDCLYDQPGNIKQYSLQWQKTVGRWSRSPSSHGSFHQMEVQQKVFLSAHGRLLVVSTSNFSKWKFNKKTSANGSPTNSFSKWSPPEMQRQEDDGRDTPSASGPRCCRPQSLPCRWPESWQTSQLRPIRIYAYAYVYIFAIYI